MQIDLSEFLIEWLRAFGSLSLFSGIAVIVVFIAAAFVFIPRTFLTLGVGGLYGFAAIPLVMIGVTAGCILAFLAARFLLAKSVWRWLDRHPPLRKIANAVDMEGWRVVALLRFASPIPGSVLNYVFGVTRIRFWPYATATFVFTAPQTVLYVYLGAAGRSLLLDDALSPLSRIIILGGAACFGTTVYLIWRKMRVVARGLDSGSTT